MLFIIKIHKSAFKELFDEFELVASLLGELPFLICLLSLVEIAAVPFHALRECQAMRPDALSAYLITIFALSFDALELLIQAFRANELILFYFVYVLLIFYAFS